MRTVAVDTDEAWHALRAKHIGGSEIAALFDLSPYFTRFMLWHDKAGTTPLPEPEHARIDWGQLLEPVIAQGVAREMRWSLEARRIYAAADDVPGMGCSVDFHVVDHEDGPGLVEIKNVDWLQWKQNWTDEHAPPHIELQVQHQLAVTRYPWGAIAVLIGGNDLKIYPRKPHLPTIARIGEAVTAFWTSIAERRAPDPFGAPAELDTLRELCKPDPQEALDLAGSYEAFETARMYAWARDQEAFHAKAKDAELAKLYRICGTAKTINLPGFDIRRDKRGRFYRCDMIEGATPPAADARPSFL